MASQLVARFSLANEETAWIVVKDVPSPDGNERYYTNIRPQIVRQAGEAVTADHEGKLRGYLFGSTGDGLNFYVDLNIPPEVLAPAK